MSRSNHDKHANVRLITFILVPREAGWTPVAMLSISL